MKAISTAAAALAATAILGAVFSCYHTGPTPPISNRSAEQNGAATAPSGTGRSTREAFGRLPLQFESNQGQTDELVKFLARGRRSVLFLTPTAAVLKLSPRNAGRRDRPDDRNHTDAGPADAPLALRAEFVGASPTARLRGIDTLPGTVNYLLGKDPSAWRTNIPTYARVQYEGMYPGIDVVFHGDDGQFEYDFVAAPGANVEQIRLKFSGAREITIGTDGDILLRTPLGELRQQRPRIFQEVAGARRSIAGIYVQLGPDEIGIRVDGYDRSQPLVIDPLLQYSTYLGGTKDDSSLGLAVDGSGAAYVVGFTESLNFPHTPGVFQSSCNNCAVDVDAFVSKLNPAGNALQYSTFLGGSLADYAVGIAVDATGNAFVAGYTLSVDFPTTPGAVKTTNNPGFEDVFVTKLNATGSGLMYSTYLGGSDNEVLPSVAIDALGFAYVTGRTSSSNFPTTAGVIQPTACGADCAFVTKLNGTGTGLVYSTYLGGGFENGLRIAVDGSGDTYVAGMTSAPFPTTAGAAQPTHPGGVDVFVTKIDPTATSLVYSTFVGGSGQDSMGGLAIDASGRAYVGGNTFSSDFPVTGSAPYSTLAGPNDGFVTEVDSTGSAFLYSTYLGGSAYDQVNNVAFDGTTGDLVVVGTTSSSDFPTTPGAVQNTMNGPYDSFIAKLQVSGTGALDYSTYIGGSDRDDAFGLGIDSSGAVYVSGFTESVDFPVSFGAFQSVYKGLVDAFVAKLVMTVLPTDLDHFWCYPAAMATPKAGGSIHDVRLTDQFQSKNTLLSTRHMLLCNPVDKRGEGILHGASHLVCYRSQDEKMNLPPGSPTPTPQPQFIPHLVDVTNQFGVQRLVVKKPQWLCVPSLKQDLGPIR